MLGTVYYFPHTNISRIKLVSSFTYTAEKMPADANLRGVAQDIVHQAKLDAFVTLMEVKKRNNYCSNKNGCSAPGGIDYCPMAKCGACVKSPSPPFGHCGELSVDVDKELAIVNSMSKEELLDLAAEVMDEYMYEDEESSSDEEFA